MRLPIIYVDGYDLLVFETREAAEGWFEPPDVQVGSVFDAHGLVLQREVDGRSVRLVATETTRPEALRDAILGTFELSGIATAANPPLSYLVVEASRTFTIRA